MRASSANTTTMCGDPSAGRGTMVWLLGNYHPAADRSIDWHGQLPNLGYPDTLVVDMTTLTENTIRQIDAEKLDRIKKSIGDKLFGGGGTIIVITSAEFSAPPNRCRNGAADHPVQWLCRPPRLLQLPHPAGSARHRAGGRGGPDFTRCRPRLWRVSRRRRAFQVPYYRVQADVELWSTRRTILLGKGGRPGRKGRLRVRPGIYASLTRSGARHDR